MTKREKTLVAAVGTAGVLWFSSQGVTAYRAALERSDEQQLTATQELEDAKLALLKGERARAQLNNWQNRSLPTNAQVAESKYNDWLRTLLKESGLVVQNLSDNKSQGSAGADYTVLTFAVDLQGSLEKLTEFLYKFHAAPHMHRISRATLSPTDTRKNVSVNLTVDALILPGCKRELEFADDSAAPEMPRPLEEIRKAIVARNIFVPYEANSKEAQVAKDWDEEAAKNVRISGLMGGGDGWLLAVRYLKDNDKIKYVRQGDSFDVGQMSLTVLRLDGRRIVLQCKDGRREVRLGQTIDQAVRTDVKSIDEASTAADASSDPADASS